MTYDASADRPTDDQADAGDCDTIGVKACKLVHNERTPPRAKARPHHCAEIRRAGHSVGRGQHGQIRDNVRRTDARNAGKLRPRALCGPYGAEPRGLNGRRAYAYAAGSRASWHADGCSAGRCACSRSDSIALGNLRQPRLEQRWSRRVRPAADDFQLVLSLVRVARSRARANGRDVRT
jgi:hypothetical protein